MIGSLKKSFHYRFPYRIYHDVSNKDVCGRAQKSTYLLTAMRTMQIFIYLSTAPESNRRTNMFQWHPKSEEN